MRVSLARWGWSSLIAAWRPEASSPRWTVPNPPEPISRTNRNPPTHCPVPTGPLVPRPTIVRQNLSGEVESRHGNSSGRHFSGRQAGGGSGPGARATLAAPALGSRSRAARPGRTGPRSPGAGRSAGGDGVRGAGEGRGLVVGEGDVGGGEQGRELLRAAGAGQGGGDAGAGQQPGQGDGGDLRGVRVGDLGQHVDQGEAGVAEVPLHGGAAGPALQVGAGAVLAGE